MTVSCATTRVDPRANVARMQGSRSRRECVIGPEVYALAGGKA